jgi:hypothetical protein
LKKGGEDARRTRVVQAGRRRGIQFGSHEAMKGRASDSAGETTVALVNSIPGFLASKFKKGGGATSFL